MLHMALLRPDGTSVDFSEDVLGIGTTGIVLRYGTNAIKIPKIRDTSKLSDNERAHQDYVNCVNREILETEKAIYRRLGRCDGIVKVLEMSEAGIALERHVLGDLETYMKDNSDPGILYKIHWVLSIIKTVRHIHGSNVLIDDIALRNILIADDYSVKMVDFGQCTLLPQHIDITKANDNGLTVQVEIFHLGCLFYSILAWRVYECNLFDRQYQQPPLEDLPKLDQILGQPVIEKCWTGKYDNTAELYEDVRDMVLTLQQEMGLSFNRGL